MEGMWASRIRNTYFRWCFSVKFMTGLVLGVVSFIVVFTMFAYVLLFCISLAFLLFLCNGIFPHRTEGGKCSMEVLPLRAIDTSFFDCLAVSVGVADLGALATDDLSCFAVTREMVFEFIATKACYKFSELFFLIHCDAAILVWKAKRPSLMTASVFQCLHIQL